MRSVFSNNILGSADMSQYNPSWGGTKKADRQRQNHDECNNRGELWGSGAEAVPGNLNCLNAR